MLTANSIIVFTNGWLITQNIKPLSNLLYFAFPGVGIVLSLLGFFLVKKGIRVEDDYRAIAYELENKCTTRHIAVDPKKGKIMWVLSGVFGIFIILYLVIIFLFINK